MSTTTTFLGLTLNPRRRQRQQVEDELRDAFEARQRAERLVLLPYTARLARGQTDWDDDLTPAGWAAAQLYYVLVFRGQKLPADPTMWLLAPVDPPPPVPNPQMVWRRPSYADALRREQAYAADPAGFLATARGTAAGLRSPR